MQLIGQKSLTNKKNFPKRSAGSMEIYPECYAYQSRVVGKKICATTEPA